MRWFRDESEISSDDYFVATYEICSSTSLREAVWNLAIGQSVGNPSVRNQWETDELFQRHSCIILAQEDYLRTITQGVVKVAFPACNVDWQTDGISHMLCQLMGGHIDIDIITRCRLVRLDLPACVMQHFCGPKYGLSGFRSKSGQWNQPLFGSIIKPKIGMSPEILLDLVHELVDGGVDFIKEDEIMSNPSFCPLERRVDLVANFLAKQCSKVVFCHTVNSDPHVVVDRVRRVHELGGNGVHVNVFSGLGVYNSVRKLDLPLFLHFQKSGDKVFTDPSHRFGISWSVLCELATLMGVDSIQTGMIGGYSNDDPGELKECIALLRRGNTIPVLSCGFHPGLLDYVVEQVGFDFMANVGGAVHGHPGGTLAGARAMRQAVDRTFGSEYFQAVAKWGKV